MNEVLANLLDRIDRGIRLSATEASKLRELVTEMDKDVSALLALETVGVAMLRMLEDVSPVEGSSS